MARNGTHVVQFYQVNDPGATAVGDGSGVGGTAMVSNRAMDFFAGCVSAGLLLLAAVSNPTPANGKAARPAALADMVRISGARFTMGRDGGPADESPAHRVTLSAFLIDRLEVTNTAFATFLNAGLNAGLNVGRGPVDAEGRRLFDWDDGDAQIHKRGGRFAADPGLGDHPVVEASWHGARAYCRWRAKRLPSEAEWELAARGPEGRKYPWGDRRPDASRARFAVGWGETVAVGSLPAGATPEGVMNMAGNTHEWVSSLYKPYPYVARDGRGDGQATGERVTRGGAADSGAETLRATWRGADVSRNPRSGHHNIGFRCARSGPR